MDNPLIYNSFMPEMHDRRWLERRKRLYANPEEYKKHLQEQANEDWEKSKIGGVSEEMSKKEAIRKKRREEEEARVAEEKRVKALGPNFPKVWDLNYFREDTHKIFKKLSSDKLTGPFLTFPSTLTRKVILPQIFMKILTN